MEPPLAQGLDILRRYVDAGDLPSDPCGPCGDATPAAADIEQLPVAEGRGETPEGELVPSLVGLEASCGIEDIWRNCGTEVIVGGTSNGSTDAGSLKQEWAENGMAEPPGKLGQVALISFTDPKCL